MRATGLKRSDLDTVTVLRIIENAQGGTDVTVPIARRYPVPRKLIIAKLELLAGKDLIEYGVAVTRSWLTAAGRKMVNDDDDAEEARVAAETDGLDALDWV